MQITTCVIQVCNLCSMKLNVTYHYRSHSQSPLWPIVEIAATLIFTLTYFLIWSWKLKDTFLFFWCNLCIHILFNLDNVKHGETITIIIFQAIKHTPVAVTATEARSTALVPFWVLKEVIEKQCQGKTMFNFSLVTHLDVVFEWTELFTRLSIINYQFCTFCPVLSS